MRLPITLGNDGIRHQPADGLGLLPPKDGLRHRVPVGDDPVRVHRDDCVEGSIENATEPPQVLVLRYVGGSSFGRGADFALDDGSQAREVALENVVVRAAAHDRHRGVFTDGSGDHDKRDIEVALLQHVKRPRGTELGQAVVGEDQVQP